MNTAVTLIQPGLVPRPRRGRGRAMNPTLFFALFIISLAVVGVLSRIGRRRTSDE